MCIFAAFRVVKRAAYFLKRKSKHYETHFESQDSLSPYPNNFYQIFFKCVCPGPALCLTSEIGDFDHIIISFISSKIPPNLHDSDILIEKDSDNWKGTGLMVDSVIRLHRIVTIPKSLIKRRLGEINDNIEQKIKVKITQLFDI